MSPVFKSQNHPKIFSEKRILKFRKTVAYPLGHMQLCLSIAPALERQVKDAESQAGLGCKGRPSHKTKTL